MQPQAYQNDLDKGVIGLDENSAIPLPPQHKTAEAARAHLKERLAASFRIFAHLNYDDGLAGHITGRDPIEPDTFWVNPVGKHFSQICVSDLVRLRHDGTKVEGAGAVNTAAFMIHSNIHKAKPEVNAVAHAHSPAGKLWSTQGRLLRPLVQDSCLFFETHVLFDSFTGVVHGQSEGEAIANTLSDQYTSVILQNHGLLTVGKDVDSAVSRFIQFERACENEVQAAHLPHTQVIAPEVARHTRNFTNSDLVVWGNFQPMFQLVEAQDDSFKN